MKILHVHCRYRDAGGEDAAVESERELLRAHGFEVVTHDAVNPDGALASAGRLLVSAWNPASYLQLARLVRRARPDVAHVHNTWFSLSPSVLDAIHRAGIPLAMTLHNYRLACVNGLLFRDGRPCTDCVGRGMWQGVVHRCYRSSALASAAVAGVAAVNRTLGTWNRDVDRFLVLNGTARDVLIASGVPTDRVQRTANFVGDPGPRPTPPSASRRLLYVGRLSYEKGADLLLEAWRAWRPDEDWTLTVVGDGALRPRCERLADHRVRFVGQVPRDRVGAMLADARVVVAPSLVFEGQPMIALEAFAAGLGVLGRGIGGTLEVVRSLGSQWAVKDATPAAWTAALDVVRHDDAVDAAGRTAREVYERTYSTEAAADRARALYEDLVRRSGTRPAGVAW